MIAQSNHHRRGIQGRARQAAMSVRRLYLLPAALGPEQTHQSIVLVTLARLRNNPILSVKLFDGHSQNEKPVA